MTQRCRPLQVAFGNVVQIRGRQHGKVLTRESGRVSFKHRNSGWLATPAVGRERDMKSSYWLGIMFLALVNFATMTQVNTGRISGTVVDATGAIVSATVVRATNE